jgi:hypothetical protein
LVGAVVGHLRPNFLHAIGVNFRKRFCQIPEARPRQHGGRLNAVKRKTEPGWGVVAVVVLGLATATPSWSEDNSGEVAPALQGSGIVPGTTSAPACFDQKGRMGGIGVPGSKITKISK